MLFSPSTLERSQNDDTAHHPAIIENTTNEKNNNKKAAKNMIKFVKMLKWLNLLEFFLSKYYTFLQ